MLDHPADTALARAAERFGTPLFTYDLARIRQQAANLLGALPAGAVAHYAFKANPSLGICRLLRDAGLGADISSEGELVTALAAGFAPERLLLTGPAKYPALLERLGAARPALVVLESLTEARRLDAMARRHGYRQDVLLRLHPPMALLETAAGEGIQVAETSSKFGLDADHLAEALPALDALPGLRLRGLHCYVASNVLDADRLLHPAGWLLERLEALRREGRPDLDCLDIGGGLGVPYAEDETAFDLARFAQGLRDLQAGASTPVRLLLEVGRYLVAESGCYLTRVLDVRESRGRTWVIVDGGIHNLLRGYNGKANRLLRLVGGDGRPLCRVSVAGCLPTPQDVLVEDLPLPLPAPGDLLALPNCGAYALHHSLLHFGLHPMPAEVALEAGDAWLLRQRGNAERLLEGQAICR
ncbi:L-glutamyl-[BtrI acyl-carrier protein] decarboxylase [compost metagenome]